MQSGLVSSRSMSYLALSLALESLLPEAGYTDNCPTCKRTADDIKIRSSVGDQVREMLVQYAGIHPDNVSSWKKRLYGVRSSIAHGDLILDADTNVSWGMNRRQHEERGTYQQMRAVVRTVMYNGLVEQQ